MQQRPAPYPVRHQAICFTVRLRQCHRLSKQGRKTVLAARNRGLDATVISLPSLFLHTGDGSRTRASTWPPIGARTTASPADSSPVSQVVRPVPTSLHSSRDPGPSPAVSMEEFDHPNVRPVHVTRREDVRQPPTT